MLDMSQEARRTSRVAVAVAFAALLLTLCSPAAPATASPLAAGTGSPFELNFTNHPGSMLVTNTLGQLAGCEENGSSVNQQGEEVAVEGCRTGDESVTVLSPGLGVYTVEVYAGQDGSVNLSVESLNGTEVLQGTSSYSASVEPSTAIHLFVNLQANGQLSISNTPPTSVTSQGGAYLLAVGAAVLIVVLAYLFRRNRPHRRPT